MAVLLAAAILVAQTLTDNADAAALYGPPDEPQVETPTDTAPTVEAAPASATVPVRGVWLRLAQCESSGRWHLNSGYYTGGLQFDRATWSRHGGTRYAPLAYQATMEQQVEIAERTLAVQGWSAWPSCSRQLGLR